MVNYTKVKWTDIYNISNFFTPDTGRFSEISRDYPHPKKLGKEEMLSNPFYLLSTFLVISLSNCSSHPQPKQGSLALTL